MMTPEELEKHLESLSIDGVKAYLRNLIDQTTFDEMKIYKKVLMKYTDLITSLYTEANEDVDGFRQTVIDKGGRFIK